MEWYGFRAPNPIIGKDEDGFLATATNFNDRFGLNFKGIADLFEENYIKESEDGSN